MKRYEIFLLRTQGKQKRELWELSQRLPKQKRELWELFQRSGTFSLRFSLINCVELFFQNSLYFVHLYFVPEFLLNGSNAISCKSAGIYVIEISHVGIYIQRKTVHGYKTAYTNSNCTYFTG